MNFFDINWNSTYNEKKHVIGYLIYDKIWIFKYSKGVKNAIKSGFRPFPELPNINETYSSDVLFKTFGSRYGSITDHKTEMVKNIGSLLTDNILICSKKGVR